MSREARAETAIPRRELKESEERFKLLVESVRDYAIFMLDPDGHIVSWNKGAERIKGWSQAEILGRHFSTFYPREDIESGKPERELVLARQFGRVEDEGWRVRKDGSLFWANVVITALHDHGGNLRGFAKVTRDLTERIKREEAERHAVLHKEASRQKDEFLAIVSHELRTPLNVVTGQAAMLRSGTLTPDQADRAWNSLQRNLALQAQIIEDLLDVSRIVTGKLSLDQRPIDIRILLDEALEEITSLAMSKGLQLGLTGPEVPATIIGDAVRLRQVLTNLLGNAVKFTPAGGRVSLDWRVEGGWVDIRVSDTGIGIDPDFLSQVFDRFSQADTTSRREFTGLGLGLAIARELVMRHGGTIGAHSDGHGRGATFQIRLPLAQEQAAGAGPAT
jgi:PAS domain S-box-containing protein